MDDTLLTTLFSFEGRMRRSEFWAVRLLTPLVLGATWFVLTTLVFVATGGRSEGHAPELAGLRSVMGLVGALLCLLLAWIDLVACVKRCHDRGKTGWFLLVSLIPLVGGFWLFVELSFIDGEHGANAYGPSPKFPDVAEAAFA